MVKKAAVKTRTSAKQKLQDYKQKALTFIRALAHPNRQSAFSVRGYDTENGVKKPNKLSVPEVLAIVGTAQQLGKFVQLGTSGVNDGGQVDFYFVDQPPNTPLDLL